jgi:hypothetical protein
MNDLTLRETAELIQFHYGGGRRAMVQFRNPDAAFAVTVADVTLHEWDDGQELHVEFEPDPAFAAFLDQPWLSVFERSFLRGSFDLRWESVEVETSGGSVWLLPGGPAVVL